MNRKRGGLADSPFFTPMREPTFEPLPRSSEVFPAIPVSNTPPALDNRTPERSNERTKDDAERPNGRTGTASERSNERTAAATPPLRSTRRYSYEFYSDQVDALRKLWAQKQVNGEKVTLSDLAREAFDQYLEAKSSQ
jgi:hypothetical protein